MAAENDSTSAAARDKALRLVEFLTKLAFLRAKVTRDVSEYQKLLWVADIPKLKGCFSQAWGRDENFDTDVWLEIQARREPDLPDVPNTCADWINSSTLRNKEDLPQLFPEITRQIVNAEWHEGSDAPKFLSVPLKLDEHPGIQKQWNEYVEQRWFPWREQHHEWEAIHKAYSTLFAIHQEQIRLGEEYELVFGLGLLCWQTPSKQRTRRHMIVADAVLDFEARLKKFVVRPNPEGARVRPELDMLDLQERPAHAESAARATLESSGDDPWEKSGIEGVLQTLVHSIDSQAEYRQSLEINGVAVSTKPVVVFAPALILRKRSGRGLTELLAKIRKRIESGEEIPCEFADLAESGLRTDAGLRDVDERRVTDSGEVFFPKPSNAEQRQIVEKLYAASGVLVQGPPGTGKSHTIANLICHLLATGQRTLITAKTPRALQVLESLVPAELRPLSINLLGGGLQEKRSLEASVGGIVNRHGSWSEKRASSERDRLANSIRQLREELAALDRRLRTIREAETHVHSIAGGMYQGTAARIAEGIRRDADGYSWFSDRLNVNSAPRFGESDLADLLATLRRFPPKKREELELSWPGAPCVEQLSELFSAEQAASDEERVWISDSDQSVAELLGNCPYSPIAEARDAFLALHDARRRLVASPHQWISEAMRDAITDNSVMWRELWRTTKTSIEAVEKLVTVADETTVVVPPEMNFKAVLDDALALVKHLKNGGGLGWWLFRPKPVAARLYLLTNVLVNGRPCSSANDFAVLADNMRVRVQCEKAWSSWAGKAERPSGTYAIQLSALKGLCEALENVLAVEQLISKCERCLRKCPGMKEPQWNNEAELQRLIATCRLVLVRQRKRSNSDEICKIRNQSVASVTGNSVHPITNELLAAFDNRKIDHLQQVVNSLKELAADREVLRQMERKLAELARELPDLAAALESTSDDTLWDDRLPRTGRAFRWAQAKYWVEEYIRQDDLPALTKRRRQIEDEVAAHTSTLASLHAWSFCFSRLTEEHRRHMEAWQQSMRRIGKGTGKHASRHRREAQGHLNKCREAVPAWVMPLHRVWDTIDPAPGMFDVIIVDEASQCGLESLPLLYLGKKILIVGDDKQISPDAVGLDRASVHHLMEELLADFQFKSSFDVESSLFDQGKLRYGTRQITLREHFRCMPEIIRFSNDLCYSDTPLIPLRQFGSERLPPLQCVFVEGGFRRGSGNRVVNEPEADAIVEKIVELCDDERYDENTMGVVVLQGEAQGDLIEQRLLERIGAEEMERRRMICGNPYSFQGDERDVIFLSLVAAPNEPIGALTKAADERRFNVAASRARDQMYLFHSVTIEELSAACLRRRLLEFFANTLPREIAGIDLNELERRAKADNRMIVHPPSPFDSWFEVDVALELARRGFDVIPQYEIAGKYIDLVVDGGNERLAIECDGDHWHGLEHYEADTDRQRQLERCGCEFIHVRESAFYADRISALQPVFSGLQQRGILPQGTADGAQLVDEALTAVRHDTVNDKLSLHADGAGVDRDMQKSHHGNGFKSKSLDELSTADIDHAILSVLGNCPNQSSTVHAMTTRVLRELKIITRGAPRANFERRVLRALRRLSENGVIQAYKAKNERVRLSEPMSANSPQALF